jgi:CheY-like chemotaxis protein
VNYVLPQTEKAGPSTLGTCAILVVEDNPSTLLLLKHMLKTAGTLETASSVDEALAKANQHVFDAFVLDINLCEERSGVDLLQALRERPHYREVPAIACTAYTRPVEREQFLSAGFNAYVSKPFTKHEILGALEQVLQLS